MVGAMHARSCCLPTSFTRLNGVCYMPREVRQLQQILQTHRYLLIGHVDEALTALPATMITAPIATNVSVASCIRRLMTARWPN